MATENTLRSRAKLTEDDPRLETPAAFRGRLYDPQATMLHAMIAAEQSRTDVLCTATYGLSDSIQCSIESTCHVLAAPFSSGKTVVALTLILAVPRLKDGRSAPIPIPIATIEQRRSSNCASVHENSFNRAVAERKTAFIPELTLLPNKVYPFSIVVASANVISQWEACAKQFTPTMRCFVVDEVRSLRQFEKLFRAGVAATAATATTAATAATAASYPFDVLFIKAGRVTTNFTVDGEPSLVKTSSRAGIAPKDRSIMGAISRVLGNVTPVTRLIIDDYDTLKLSGDDCFILAQSTWLLSATRRQTTAKFNLGNGATTADFVLANMPMAFPVLGSALDGVLNSALKIQCTETYLNAHISTTVVGFRRIFVRGGMTTNILRNLDIPDHIMEMINGDAVGTAAQALGLEATTIGDVIRRVVGKHLDAYQHTLRVLANSARARAILISRKYAAEDVGGAGSAGATAGAMTIPEIRAALKAGATAGANAGANAGATAGTTAGATAGAPAGATAGAPAGATAGDDLHNTFLAVLQVSTSSTEAKELHASLDSLNAWAHTEQESQGILLNRMRDNIREGHCQCCKLPFQDPDADPEDQEPAYVLSCCQVITCESCITRKYDQVKSFIQRCPNCRAATSNGGGLGMIRIGAEVNLKDALDDNLLAEISAEPAAESAAEPATAQPKGPVLAPKLQALVMLIQSLLGIGAPAIDCIRDEIVPPFIFGLLTSHRNIPRPPTAPVKILIFAMHHETTNTIAEQLTRLGIKYCEPVGQRRSKNGKDAQVAAFRDNIPVMLVTSADQCSGLHLPCISHVIFYHRVVDPNIEAQVAGRGQRIGREFNLQVISLLNESEARGIV